MWRSRMFWRLFATNAILVLVSIGLLGLMIDSRVERRELQLVEDALRAKALLVEEAVRDRPAGHVAILQERLKELRSQIQTRITLVDAAGNVLVDSDENPAQMENHAQRPEFVEAAKSGSGTSTRYSTTTQQPMMYSARRAAAAAAPVAFVRVALPLDSVEAQIASLRTLVWTVAGLAALASLGLAFLLARRVSLPVQELTAGAERIAAGNYGHKVYAVGQDEIGILARAFNAMSERLDEQFAQVKEDREQLRAVLGGMIEGVVAIDGQQRVLFANERAGQLLEFQPAGAVGRKIWEVIRQRPIHEVVEKLQRMPDPFQRQELDLNGPAARHLAMHAAQLPGTGPRGAVLVLHDTTELRRLERLRQEFVANVSHELKTPLSVIKACVETLLDGAVEDPENRGAFLEQIAEQGNRLHALILDLLSLARIESGQEAFEFGTVSVADTVGDCLQRHRARAEGKGQVLEAVPPAEGDVSVWADEEAVSQVLDNLVDNALKYTPSGGKIGVRWHVEETGVCLEVSDTGIGIPPQDLPRIFERFYRVDKDRSRELGGTGLGLSIVKHTVQAMAGSVSAASKLGQGTTFSVRLPQAPVT